MTIYITTDLSDPEKRLEAREEDSWALDLVMRGRIVFKCATLEEAAQILIDNPSYHLRMWTGQLDESPDLKNLAAQIIKTKNEILLAQDHIWAKGKLP